MWGETRIAYSCFLPDTEGGRWRAKERKERKREGGKGRVRESSPLCDVHWCSCSSRSNAASVLCSSSSRLPSAPLNYSQPEDVQCGLPPPFLSPPSLHIALCLSSSVSHPFLSLLCDGLFQRQWTEVSPCKLVNPPHPFPHPLIFHQPPNFHHLTSYLALLLSSPLIPCFPLLAARLEPVASFFKGKAASC